MQAVFRNPLADPHIMGVSSGAGLGAAIATLAGARIFHSITSPAGRAGAGDMAGNIIAGTGGVGDMTGNIIAGTAGAGDMTGNIIAGTAGAGDMTGNIIAGTAAIRPDIDGILQGISLAGAASLGALLISLLVIYISRKVKGTDTLLIFGVMTGFAVNAIISILQSGADPESLRIFYSWSAGSFTNCNYTGIAVITAAGIIGSCLAFNRTKGLDILLFGDEYSSLSGAMPEKIRWVSLTGCCIEKKADRLVMAATDGKRLARISRPADGLPDIGRPIVPTPFLDALKGVLDGDGQAELAVHNGRLYLKAGTIYAYTSLIKGSYPYYTRVIPEEFKLSARVETKDIRTAFDIILNATNTEVSHKARFELEEDKGMLSSVTEEYDGKASVKVAYKGEPFSFLVSDKLFSSMVAKVPDDTFTLSLISPTTAIGMTWDSDPDALYIIMPMAS